MVLQVMILARFAPRQNWGGELGETKTGDIGLEPILTDPESAVLPLHQSPSVAWFSIREPARLYIVTGTDQLLV